MTARPNAIEPEPEEADDPVLAKALAVLPVIDETDPAFEAYLREAVREALDDPRPSVPIEEAFAAVERRFREDMRRRGRAVPR